MANAMQGMLMTTFSREELQVLIRDGLSEALAEIRPQEKKYLTRRDVAERFSVTLCTVGNWVKSGRLKSVRVGGRVLFPVDEVERMEKKKICYVGR